MSVSTVPATSLVTATSTSSLASCAASKSSTPSESKAKPVPKISNMCIIGDSISGILDHKIIAETTKTKVRTARAYSSIEETSENEAREKTRFPEKSFAEVINSELKKEQTDILLIQSGSVDITNMKTKDDNPKKYGEYFKQQAIMSASNLFTTVSNALTSNPDLKKAIIMKQVPRHDPSSSDPQSIKAALAQLYNDTVVQLWLGSSLKDRITIGSHSLECSGGVRDARYRQGKRYDGIHMYGPSGRKAYTESVLTIMRNGGHIKSPPPSYFRRYHKSEDQAKPRGKYTCPTEDTDYLRDKDIRYKQNSNPGFQYAVPTSNRFSSFNQGNC